MRKRLHTCTRLLIAVLLTSTAFSVLAQDWAGGSGTLEDPYLVDSPERLAAINKDSESLQKHYKLTKDIDLNDTNWTPIGNDDNAFAGTFDGNGYTISGLNVSVGNTNAGLFYMIDENGCVLNLGVTGTNGVTGKSNAGGIAGQNSGTIKNCYTSMPVTSTTTDAYKYAGGIAGVNWGTIECCYTTGAVTNEVGYAGGIVGSNAYTLTSPRILYCYATGAISGNKAGGICILGMGGQVKNCIALNSAITGTGASSSTGRIAELVEYAQMSTPADN